MPTCPKCGRYVRRDQTVCPHCLFKADFEQIAKEEDERRKARLALKTAEDEAAAAREAQIRREAVSMPVVTLPYVPGREIERVVGVVTADVVLERVCLPISV